jgi:putative hemolysin
MVIENNLIPMMTDRSLAQMMKAGMKYAAMPKPVFVEWCQWASVNGTRTADHSFCIGRSSEADDVDSVEVYESEDGDVYLCLLPGGHDGDCGFEHLV